MPEERQSRSRHRSSGTPSGFPIQTTPVRELAPDTEEEELEEASGLTESPDRPYVPSFSFMASPAAADHHPKPSRLSRGGKSFWPF